MKEMPLLSSPVSTTVAALRQYWRCLMPVPASPLAYTDGWRCLLSRTTQVTEDQLHLEGGEDPLPRAVAVSPSSRVSRSLYRIHSASRFRAETGLISGA